MLWRGQKGIPHGLKPRISFQLERPKAKALGYLEATRSNDNVCNSNNDISDQGKAQDLGQRQIQESARCGSSQVATLFRLLREGLVLLPD
jgi:hypothetical protein